MADDDLDDILSSALDDLEEDNNDDSGNQNADLGNAVKAAAEASAKSAQEGGEAAAAGAAGGAGDPFGMGFDLSDMQEVLKELQDGDLGKVLEAALKMGDGEEDGDENPLLAAMRAAGGEGGAGADVAGADEQTAKLLQMLAQSSGAAEGAEPQLDEFAENLMGQVAQEFEGMAGKDDFESFMGGMMKQLLSKDVMYTPLKQVCDKFPEWLADNQAKISEEEYTRYGKQYQIYQRAVATYDTEGDNSERVAELLQDAQDLGQLPADLIKDLAPGLEFGNDGLPVMPNMGPGVMPPNAELMENCKQQ